MSTREIARLRVGVLLPEKWVVLVPRVLYSFSSLLYTLVIKPVVFFAVTCFVALFPLVVLFLSLLFLCVLLCAAFVCLTLGEADGI